MQSIVGTTITLTKGDTFKATVTMETASGEKYTPAAGDVIRFALKKNYSDAQPLIHKTIPHDTMLLQLVPSDTSERDIGKYVYDIEITYANGDIDTFIDRAQFILTEEVY